MNRKTLGLITIFVLLVVVLLYVIGIFDRSDDSYKYDCSNGLINCDFTEYATLEKPIANMPKIWRMAVEKENQAVITFYNDRNDCSTDNYAVFDFVCGGKEIGELSHITRPLNISVENGAVETLLGLFNPSAENFYGTMDCEVRVYCGDVLVETAPQTIEFVE